MKIIKVSSGPAEYSNLLLRQTPGMKGVWGDCNFFINTQIEKCDWWFVLHGSGIVNNEDCITDPKNIVYVSMEPNEKISKVSNKFLEQFSHLISCDRTINQQNVINMNWHTWWVGINVTKSKFEYFSKKHNFDYDDFVKMNPIKKINKMSIIMSNKNISDGHQKRINFINQIINSPLSKFIDVYGDGYIAVPDKWNAIEKYKYHLVIENSVEKDYWSEKLADSFLGFSIPIYFGCPNISDYFSDDSMVLIDINDYDESFKLIASIFKNDLYNEKLQAIYQARSMVLNKYNIFNLMTQFASSNANEFKRIELKTNYYFSDSFFKKIARLIFNKIRIIF